MIDVKLLVKDCGYHSTIEDEIVRDRLVYGTISQKLCEKFINRGFDLNLKSAITLLEPMNLLLWLNLRK